MQNHFDLFFIFKSFSTEIQNQYGVSIHTFYSDNPLEYLFY